VVVPLLVVCPVDRLPVARPDRRLPCRDWHHTRHRCFSTLWPTTHSSDRYPWVP